MLIFGAGFAAMFLGGVLFLTEQWHYSTLQAGFAMTPGPILVASSRRGSASSPRASASGRC